MKCPRPPLVRSFLTADLGAKNGQKPRIVFEGFPHFYIKITFEHYPNIRGGERRGGPRGRWKYFLTDKHLVRRLQRPSGKQSLNCIANQLHQVLDVMLALCTAHAAAHLSARKAGGARGKSLS